MSSSKNKTPITILNGFLGAGKTTLLQSLLVQGRSEKNVELGVIVNEMSELDVDGRVLHINELFSNDDERLASISAGSISSDEGLIQFTNAVDKLKQNGVTHIIIETSGSTHPWPLLEAIRKHNSVQLHGFLSVVDTLTLVQDYDLGRSIVPEASRHIQAGRRGIENLLAEQMLFASRILLSKMDRVSSKTLQAVGKAIHPINPWVEIMGMQWGNVRLKDVLSMPVYDHDRVAKLGAELAEWDKEQGGKTMSGPSDYRIESIVISDPRPFHPQRLWNVYNHYLGTDIYRSKGFFWLPSRDRFQLLWNQTAGSVGFGALNYWKIAALEDESLNLTQEEKDEMGRRLADASPEFGDRNCRFTIIGDRDNIETFATALKECFCTPQEIASWKAGKEFDDPWPETRQIMLYNKV